MSDTFYCHKRNVEQMDEVTADNCEKVFFISLPDYTGRLMKLGVLGLVLTQILVAKLLKNHGTINQLNI